MIHSKAEFSKLAALRAKTDHQLVAIIRNKLMGAIRLVGSVATPSARQRAEKSYAEAQRLLPWVSNAGERAALGEAMAELRGILDGHELCRAMGAHSACS